LGGGAKRGACWCAGGLGGVHGKPNEAAQRAAGMCNHVRGIMGDGNRTGCGGGKPRWGRGCAHGWAKPANGVGGSGAGGARGRWDDRRGRGGYGTALGGRHGDAKKPGTKGGPVWWGGGAARIEGMDAGRVARRGVARTSFCRPAVGPVRWGQQARPSREGPLLLEALRGLLRRRRPPGPLPRAGGTQGEGTGFCRDPEAGFEAAGPPAALEVDILHVSGKSTVGPGTHAVPSAQSSNRRGGLGGRKRAQGLVPSTEPRRAPRGDAGDGPEGGLGSSGVWWKRQTPSTRGRFGRPDRYGVRLGALFSGARTPKADTLGTNLGPHPRRPYRLGLGGGTLQGGNPLRGVEPF